MLGTTNCTYETPCGWCTKWDKKCDKKIGEDRQRTQPGIFLDNDMMPGPSAYKVVDYTGSYVKPGWTYKHVKEK